MFGAQTFLQIMKFNCLNDDANMLDLKNSPIRWNFSQFLVQQAPPHFRGISLCTKHAFFRLDFKFIGDSIKTLYSTITTHMYTRTPRGMLWMLIKNYSHLAWASLLGSSQSFRCSRGADKHSRNSATTESSSNFNRKGFRTDSPQLLA